MLIQKGALRQAASPAFAPGLAGVREAMVGLGGLEPPASPLSGVRSNHLSYRPVLARLRSPQEVRFDLLSADGPAQSDCGADRDRTDDPLLAKQVLSQLSYSPVMGPGGCAPRFWMQVSCVGTLGWWSRSRKEVIQPHLPIRLPCYDFTPVMNHSVASVLLAVRLPASGATHSHGVTGGVYKARERIHRDNADSRLLAIPTSRSRVADSDPD